MEYSRGILLCLLLVCNQSCFEVMAGDDSGNSRWNYLATKDMETRFRAWRYAKAHRAKNLILVIGDGMGISTVSAARALKANLHKKLVGDETLTFEKFPFTAFSKTYSSNHVVADSAATATAYWCGVKVNQDTIGVDDRVKYEDRESHRPENNLKCLSHHAHDAKKSVGILTTVTVTHASPAPAYAHSASREWETDRRMRDADREAGYKDIALQFIESGGHVDILMGAGRNYFENRTDKRNLTNEWLLKRGESGTRKPMYVRTKAELQDAVHNGATDLLGLFSEGNSMLYSALPRGSTKEPTLAEMVEAALIVLKRNPNGFLLFIEGGKIDWGHHDNQAALALYDTIAMDDAVRMAYDHTPHDDTLIVVTADHSHVFAFGGYPLRNQSILGVSDRKAADNKSFTFLSYGNGPGFAVSAEGRRNISSDEVFNVTYKQQSAVPLDIDTHGGEDVPIYAIGPMSYLFTGVLEQHTIPHLMMHAACIGPKKSYTCPPKRSSAATFTNSPVTFNLLKVGLTVQLTWAIFSWIRLN